MTIKGMRRREDLEEFRSRMYKCYRAGFGSNISSDDYAVRAPYLRRLIRTQFPSDREARILDLGCGSGILLRCLQEAGYRKLAGVDVSPVQVGAVQPDLSGEIVRGDLFEVLSDAESGSFDVLVAFDVVEHLGKTELLNLADEAQRVLKPGGRWIVHAPNAAGFFGGRVRYADLTHEHGFTRESLEQLLRASGFGDAVFIEDRCGPRYRERFPLAGLDGSAFHIAGLLGGGNGFHWKGVHFQSEHSVGGGKTMMSTASLSPPRAAVDRR